MQAQDADHRSIGPRAAGRGASAGAGAGVVGVGGPRRWRKAPASRGRRLWRRPERHSEGGVKPPDGAGCAEWGTGVRES
jgi:hypothetical protein